MKLSGVTDLAGNKLAWPVTWSFTVADFGASDTTACISGLHMMTEFAQYDATNVSQDTALFLKVSSSRIAPVEAFASSSDTSTFIKLCIKPPTGGADTETATSLAAKLALAVASNEPDLMAYSSYADLDASLVAYKALIWLKSAKECSFSFVLLHRFIQPFGRVPLLPAPRVLPLNLVPPCSFARLVFDQKV